MMEEYSNVRLEDIQSKEFTIDSLPDFRDIKQNNMPFRKDRLTEHTLWKKLGVIMIERIQVRGSAMSCLVREGRQMSVSVLVAFDQKKLMEEHIEVPTLKAILPSQRFAARLSATSFKEVVHLDSRKGLGIYHRIYRIAPTCFSDFIQSQQTLGKKQFIELAKDLIRDLFSYHQEARVLNRLDLDQVVMGSDGKWFLVATQHSSLIEAQGEAVHNKDRHSGKTNVEEPASTSTTLHSSIKSDVSHLGKLLQHVIRALSPELIADTYLEQCMLLLQPHNEPGMVLYPVPSLLQAMTEPVQQQRFTTLELMLLMNETSWFTSKISVPYERFFSKTAIKSNPACNYARVQYQHVPVVIEGELRHQLFERTHPIGKEIKGLFEVDFRFGVLSRNGEVLYEGQFRNNQPEGAGKLLLADSWQYEGEIKDGALHGTGTITYQQQIIYKGQFHHNRPIRKPSAQFSLRPSTVYFMRKTSDKQHRLYCRPHDDDGESVVLNLTAVDNEQLILQFFRYFKMKESTIELTLKENVWNNRWSMEAIDHLAVFNGTYNYDIYCKCGKGKVLTERLLNQKVTGLDLGDCVNLTPEELKGLLLKNELPCLQSVVLRGLQLRDNLWIPFLSQKQKLSMIDLSDTKITEHGLSLLLHSEINRITSLKLNGLKLENYSVIKRLIASEKCTNLQTLEMVGARVEGSLLLASFELQNPPLRVLSLAKCPLITDKAFEQLFSLLNWGELRDLNLAHTNISNRVVETMCCCPSKEVSELQRLSLAGCLNVKSTALRSLFHSQRFAMARWLDLSGTQLCDEGLLELAEDVVMKRLSGLSISGCFNLTLNSVRQFLASGKINKFEYLDISRLKIRGYCIETLQKAKGLQLKTLCCPIMEEEELLAIAGVISLEELKLECAQLSISSLSYLGFITKLHELQRVGIWCDEQLASALLKLYGEKICFTFRDHGSLRLQGLDIVAQKPTISRQTTELIDLSRSLLFEQVNELNLSKEYSLNERHLSNLFATPYSRNIKSIDISNSCLGARFLEALLLNRLQPQQNQMANLKRLSLASVKDNIDEVFSSLCRTGIFDKLEFLNLSWTNIRNTPLQVLAETGNIVLKQLSISNTAYVTDQPIKSIIESRLCTSLQKLNLSHTKITNRTLEALSSSHYCGRLTTLLLNGCENVSGAGLKKYLSSEKCCNLTVLDVSSLKVDNTLFQVFTGNPRLQLKKLSVTGVDGCWAGLQKYIESSNFESLEHLDLSFSTVKEKHLLRLLTSRIGRLATVGLKKTCVGEEFKKKLEEVLAISQKRKRTRHIDC